MDKNEELSRLERQLLFSNGDEKLFLMEKIRVLERELYPYNEIRFASILQPLDEVIMHKLNAIRARNNFLRKK